MRKSLKKKSQNFIFILFMIPICLFGQKVEEKDSVRSKYIEYAKEIMKNSGFCTLITLDHEGFPRARTMDPFTPEEDLTVWLGTNPKSRKVIEIKKDPRVTLYYFDGSAAAYVTIQGTAELVNDKESKEKYWKDHWTAFYPDSDEHYLLIKVSPNQLELVSYKHGIEGDSIYWTPPVIDLSTDRK
jgi:general stress protein 26